MQETGTAAPSSPAGLRPALLVFAAVLGALAGYVDAVGFQRLVGVFPSNQSGNLVFLGMAIGGSSPLPAWRTATTILSFAAGVVAAFMVGRRLRDRIRPAVLLGSELGLLTLVAVVAGPIRDDHLVGGFSGGVLVVLTSLALGVQTEVIRHTAGVAVATTYQTGALVRMAEAIGPNAGSTPSRRSAGLVVLGSVLLAYLAGATIGASPVGELEWALALPCAVLAILVGTLAWRPTMFLGRD